MLIDKEAKASMYMRLTGKELGKIQQGLARNEKTVEPVSEVAEDEAEK